LAIQVEREIRDWSPLRIRSNLTGIVSIGDLARGAQMTLSDVYDNERPLEGQAASTAVLGKQSGSSSENWLSLLLTTTRRDEHARPSITVQALDLGGAMLLSEQYQASLARLVYAFQADLYCAVLAHQALTGSETTATRRARELIWEIDQRLGIRFRGIREFR
jgi:hypothetical protein